MVEEIPKIKTYFEFQLDFPTLRYMKRIFVNSTKDMIFTDRFAHATPSVQTIKLIKVFEQSSFGTIVVEFYEFK